MPRFAIASASHRAGTEDRALVLPIEAGWVVVVADGTGGISGGARAAELLVDGVRRAAQEGFAATDPASWVDLLVKLDHEIADDSSAGETTAVALMVSAGQLIGASAGDSRAFLFTASGAEELTGRQSRRPRLGTGQAKPLPFSATARGVLVVGTDGLFDYVKLDDISRIIRAPVAPEAESLIGLVRERHRTLPDDVAVVVGWMDG